MFYAVFFLAAIIRMVQFGQHPAGLNQDEASIGYDAYAIMKYGIDRCGCTLPVHLMAWGSGQNALYAYLSMPFIALLGLNVFSVRLVNLIFALISLPAMYAGVKSISGKRAGLAAMALLAISPWNIMLSRWGLESNLFPSLLIIAFWLVMTCTKSRIRLFAGAVILAACLYSYGAAYLVITVFIGLCAVFYLFALKKKKAPLPMPRLIGAAALYALLSLPIYLFMLINVFGLDTIHIGALTIPHTYGGRIASSAGATPLSALKNFAMMCILQTDGYSRNAFPFYGCFYVISLPFAVYGMIKEAKSKKRAAVPLFALLVSSLLLFAFYGEPNINRVNAVYVPLIIFTALGIEALWPKRKVFAAVCLAYALCFAGFNAKYFGREFKEEVGREFFESFGDALAAADMSRTDDSPVHVCTQVNMPYIYALFYTRPDPHVFVETVEYYNPGDQFQAAHAYKGWRFDFNDLLDPQKGVYVIENENVPYISQFTDKIYMFKNYSVAVIG